MCCIDGFIFIRVVAHQFDQVFFHTFGATFKRFFSILPTSIWFLKERYLSFLSLGILESLIVFEQSPSSC